MICYTGTGTIADFCGKTSLSKSRNEYVDICLMKTAKLNSKFEMCIEKTTLFYAGA